MSNQSELEFNEEGPERKEPLNQTIKPSNSKKSIKKIVLKDFDTIFLLMELEQFEKFEHWIRMGLIYLDSKNSDSKLNGLAEELGAIPISFTPVIFDVLVEVTLAPNEKKKITPCESNRDLGWLSPGMLPISRVKNVYFSSQKTLESTSKLLSEGSVVSEVLKAYQTQFKWNVADIKNSKYTEEQVISIFKSEFKLNKVDLLKKIRDWDKQYGQLSFLKSLPSAVKNIKLTTNLLAPFKFHLGKSWKALAELEANLDSEVLWQGKEFYSGINISETILAYIRNDHAPETIKTLREHPESFAQKLGAFIEDADLRWGKVLSENQPLVSNFEVIEQLSTNLDLDSYLLTQAIITLSYSGHRLNLNAFGELPSSAARTRNFMKDGEWVYMTPLPSDSMNVFLLECCFSSIQEEVFDNSYWLNQLNLNEDDVIDLTDSQVTIFGIRLERNLSSAKSTKMFLEIANRIREENELLRVKCSELEGDLNRSKGEIKDRDFKLDNIRKMLDS